MVLDSAASASLVAGISGLLHTTTLVCLEWHVALGFNARNLLTVIVMNYLTIQRILPQSGILTTPSPWPGE